MPLSPAVLGVAAQPRRGCCDHWGIFRSVAIRLGRLGRCSRMGCLWRVDGWYGCVGGVGVECSGIVVGSRWWACWGVLIIEGDEVLKGVVDWRSSSSVAVAALPKGLPKECGDALVGWSLCHRDVLVLASRQAQAVDTGAISCQATAAYDFSCSTACTGRELGAFTARSTTLAFLTCRKAIVVVFLRSTTEGG